MRAGAPGTRKGPGRSRALRRRCTVDAGVRVVVAVLVDADGRLGRVTVLVEGDRAGRSVVVDLAALGEEGGAPVKSVTTSPSPVPPET